MSKVFQFGEEVSTYEIRVLNEREIRAAAGILFLMMFIAILNVIYTNSFLLLKYAVVIFLVDFLIRILVSPRYAPTLILGRLIVLRQTPEYVGARQKQFAWIIGVVLAITMFVLLVTLNTFSPITGLICFICLIFLFFESAFGICLGCLMYPWFFRGRVQYCPGEICKVKDRHDIQKISLVQVLIVLVFALFIVLLALYFHEVFMVEPSALFGEGTHEI